MRAQDPFQQAQRRQCLVIIIWWRFGWRPVVPTGARRGWWSVPVRYVQNQSVSRPFVSVTYYLPVDGFGDAELLGQRGEAGGRDEDPPAAALRGEVERGEGFQRLVHRRPRQTHRCGEVETCQWLLRVFHRLVHQRRRYTQLQEHRPQRVQLPASPVPPTGPIGVPGRRTSSYRSPSTPRFPSISSINASGPVRNARKWAATVVWSTPAPMLNDRVPKCT